MEQLWNAFLGGLPWTFFGALGAGCILIVLICGRLRREAIDYTKKGMSELREFLGLGPLILRGVATLWGMGRKKAVERWPSMGRQSALYAFIAAGGIGAMTGLAGYQALALLQPPKPIANSVLSRTWTSDSDWNDWSLDGLEVSAGALSLKNVGGKGNWTQLKEQVTLSGAWQQLAATNTDVWLSDGGQDVVQVDLTSSEARWTKHEDVVMANTMIGAIWAQGRECAVFGQNGSVKHWLNGKWNDEGTLSLEDGEHLKALCAFGDSWTDLYVGSTGAIFHHTAAGWTEEVKPGSRIGAFTGIVKAADGAIWATNDIGGAGSIWRKDAKGWRMAFEAPISWQGITSFEGRVLAYCKYGYLYEMEQLKDGNVNGKPISQEVSARSVSGWLVTGQLKDGVNCRDLRTGKPIPGPTNDDLSQVVQVKATTAWAISGSAVYKYETEPKYLESGTATIVLWRTAALERSIADMLSSVPSGTSARVDYSNDGKSNWADNMANLPPADSGNLLVVCRLRLTGTERSTPEVRALTIGPSPH